MVHLRVWSTWSPHSFTAGMLISSTNTVSFLPPTGPYVRPWRFSTQPCSQQAHHTPPAYPSLHPCSCALSCAQLTAGKESVLLDSFSPQHLPALTEHDLV